MRISVFSALTLCLLWPATVFATCNGTDQRLTFSAQQHAELNTRLADMPFAQGNHWRAQKGGQNIHVIGTVHLDDSRIDAITQRLAPLITAADLVFLEANEAEETKLKEAVATRPDVMFIREGPTLLEQMGKEDWAKLAKAAEARGIPAFVAAKFQPWYLSLMLGMPPCVLSQMAQGIHGLDHRVRDVATSAGVPVLALEPWDTLFSIFGQDPMEEQIEMLKIGITSVETAENAVATLMAQYFDQDHGAVMDTSRVALRDTLDMDRAEFDAVFDDMLDSLLTQRNLKWMTVLDKTRADNIVVAVGAGHLSGENGVLNLLAQRGYTLTRMAV